MAYPHVDAVGLILPGIHFGIPEDDYHKDPALGSTDIGRLDRSISLYWWHSRLNPMRPRIKDDTADKIAGRAVHAIVLEGRQAFESRFLRRPEDAEDATQGEKGQLTKLYKATAAGEGKTLLSADTFDRCVVAGANIAANEDLAEAFHGGEPEVSVFWTRELEDGFVVRLKARFDYLKIIGIGDLKSVANERDLDFPEACLNHMRWHRYPRQATHYFDGRSQMAAFHEAGAVFGIHDPAWLRRVCRSTSPNAWLATQDFHNPEDAGWQWVFWQKTRTPEVWTWTLRPHNAIVAWERQRIAAALARYSDALRRFGTERQWTTSIRTTEITLDDLGPYYGR